VRSGAGHRTANALHIASSAAPGGAAPVVWVRSTPFAVPTSGRLSLLAWIRTSDVARQPILRLAVEAKLDGRVKYWKANVGASEDGQPAKPLTSEWSAFRFPIVDLPQTGLTDLRVGFDLMGEGEVWIDEVQVFDLWFEENERAELLKSIATADLQVGSGRLAESQAFLTSYWPSFLRRNVKLPNGSSSESASLRSPGSTAGEGGGTPASRSSPPGIPATAPETLTPPRAASPSLTERLKSWIPKSWR
jgi:hypothetical protein